MSRSSLTCLPTSRKEYERRARPSTSTAAEKHDEDSGNEEATGAEDNEEGMSEYEEEGIIVQPANAAGGATARQGKGKGKAALKVQSSEEDAQDSDASEEDAQDSDTSEDHEHSRPRSRATLALRRKRQLASRGDDDSFCDSDDLNQLPVGASTGRQTRLLPARTVKKTTTFGDDSGASSVPVDTDDLYSGKSDTQRGLSAKAQGKKAAGTESFSDEYVDDGEHTRPKPASKRRRTHNFRLGRLKQHAVVSWSCNGGNESLMWIG